MQFLIYWINNTHPYNQTPTQLMNSTHKFDPCFYLSLTQIKSHLVYAHYAQEPKSEDKLYCERMIFFKEIKSIQISLGESNNQIRVKVTFLNDKNKFESHDLTGSYKSFYFANFTQAAEYINLLTSFVYSRAMFDITSGSEPSLSLDYAPHYSKLDEFESCLLSLTFASGCQSNLSVSEVFNSSGELKYYYDVKMFQYVGKTTLVSFEAQDGYETRCSIVFFDAPLLTMENSHHSETYSVELIDVEDRDKYVISRLSKENYSKLKTWIESKLD